MAKLNTNGFYVLILACLLLHCILAAGQMAWPRRSLLGFGCPFDAYQCNDHCISIGRNHGYCGGFLRSTCYCGSS